jgi:hypothetical protein
MSLANPTLTKCRFNQIVLQPNSALINYCLNQILLQPIDALTKQRFNQIAVQPNVTKLLYPHFRVILCFFTSRVNSRQKFKIEITKGLQNPTVQSHASTVLN